MSAVCHVFIREITAPIALSLTVEVTSAGLIEHLEGSAPDGLHEHNCMRVQRAILFIAGMLQAIQDAGHLIADAIPGLPADFAIERSILTVLADVQSDMAGAGLSSFFTPKPKPGSLN